MTKLNTCTTKKLETMKEKIERAGAEINEEIILELLEELKTWELLEGVEGLTIENIEFSKNRDGEIIRLGEAEYLILTEEKADDLFKERIEELIKWNEFSSIFSGLNSVAYMDEDILEEMVVEDLEWWVSGLSEEELKEEMKHYGVENEENLIEEKIDHVGAIDYLLDFMDEDDLVKTLIDRGGFNMEEMIEDIIRWDGRGVELATYDGVEIELSKNDVYAYRIS